MIKYSVQIKKTVIKNNSNGNAASYQQDQENKEMAFCANCGEKMDDGVKFCPKCGIPAGGGGRLLS
jgi:hypothetical protein